MQPIVTKRFKGDPKSLLVVTSSVVKKDGKFAPFYQPRHDEAPPQSFVEDIARQGVLMKPLVIKFNGANVVVDGSKRVLGAAAAKLKEIEYDLVNLSPKTPEDWARIRDIQVGANEQRIENKFTDRVHNILAYVQPDKKGKPAGLSYEETGKRFNVSHQTIRDYVALATLSPKWFIEAIDDKQISVTEASKLLKANRAAGGDEDTLREAFDKWRAGAKPSGEGKVARKSGSGGDVRGKAEQLKQAKRVRALAKEWEKSDKTPTPVKLVLQVLLGIITPEEARAKAGGKFDTWMTLELPEKPKAEKKAKGKKAKGKAEDEEIEEDDFLDEEEVEEDDEEILEDDELTEDDDEDFDDDDE